MLRIKISGGESWDEANECFVYPKDTEICIEHSLVSISKWESKWHKPFLNNNSKRDEKTLEELLDYVKCMTLTQNVDPEVYSRLSSKNIEDITRYIDDPMTATTTHAYDEAAKKNKGKSKETVTSELIYYWMFSLNIPKECEKWHINRLITLIKVCSIKNSPPKKQSKRSMAKQRSALNAKRRAAMHSKG